MRLTATCLLPLAVAFACAARADEDRPVPPGGKLYAQHLVDLAHRAHPDIASLSVYAPRDEGKPAVEIGSTSRARAGAVPGEAATVMAQNRTIVRGAELWEPMQDVSGDTLGAIHIVFRGRSASRAQAAALRAWMGRHTLSAKNLYDPYPYDPRYREDTYAQALADRTMAAHPELLVLALHSTPPGQPTNVISGSNIGRIGKAADEDDLRVIEKGATNLEIAETGKRFEVELPLNDRSGVRIGALGCVFAYKPGDDKAALAARAVRIRDEIARQIPSAAALARPR
jgi:hypothetical protein